MPALPPAAGGPVDLQSIEQAHSVYCQLTGQTLRLGFDRQRMWYELLRAGFSLEDLRVVVTYLQREIRAQRRNVGALKLCNLLQLDRFEEDLQISRVRLRAPPPSAPRPPASQPLSALEQQRGRQRALECLRQIKQALRQKPTETNLKLAP
jgi:hypothetical protein